MFRKIAISLTLFVGLLFSSVAPAGSISLIPAVRTIKTSPIYLQADFERYILKKNRNINKMFVEPIAKWIVYYSVIRGLDPFTVLSIVNVESSFWKNKKGKSGEIGLMQPSPRHWVHDKRNKKSLQSVGIVKPPTKKNPNPEVELFVIAKNISAGTYILTMMRSSCEIWEAQGRLIAKDYHDVNECMIRRYNGGHKRRTKAYYQKVTATLGDYYYFAKTNSLRSLPMLAQR